MSRRTFTLMVVFSLILALLLAAGPLQSVSATVLYVHCYVDASRTSGANTGVDWTNAYTDLQSALGGSSCTEVWVAAGAYKPTGGTDRTATFQLKSSVAVYGGFAGTESALTDHNPTAHVTITAGNANGNPPDDSGGHRRRRRALPWVTLVTCRGYNEASRSYQSRLF